jgi:hypothetical protein
MAAALRRSVNQRRRWLEEKVTETNHKKNGRKKDSPRSVFFGPLHGSPTERLFFLRTQLGAGLIT